MPLISSGQALLLGAFLKILIVNEPARTLTDTNISILFK
jgi:hypothetical protein